MELAALGALAKPRHHRLDGKAGTNLGRDSQHDRPEPWKKSAGDTRSSMKRGWAAVGTLSALVSFHGWTHAAIPFRHLGIRGVVGSLTPAGTDLTEVSGMAGIAGAPHAGYPSDSGCFLSPLTHRVEDNKQRGLTTRTTVQEDTMTGSTHLHFGIISTCLLYTSDAADEEDSVDLGGRRIIKK